ncbi:MAG: kinase/pyrophosphorylase, partial [Pseudomonadota bacterium]|nr:kinase/pyrophosphorylase [Pseudomonadota bacterium]
ADLDNINDELKSARQLFSGQNWPVLDVSRRSIDQTAAAVLHLYMNKREEKLSTEISDETAL